MTRLSRSPDLERLREDGYEVFIHRTGYLVLNNIPYVDSSCVVRRGRLVSELTVEADVTIQPRDHVVMWSGDAPCDRDGNPLRLGGGPAANQLADDLVVDRTFSSKPRPTTTRCSSTWTLRQLGPGSPL